MANKKRKLIRSSTEEETTLAAPEDAPVDGDTEGNRSDEETYEDQEGDPNEPVNPSSVEEEVEEIQPELVEKILEPFTKEQLIEILREAAESHPDVMDRVTRVAESDPVHRKIFVHGLGWDTTAETLTEAFRKYGEIEDCNAIRDKVTGKSKGYGFILFKRRVGARRALLQPQKMIGNRMTSCQLASAGPVPSPAPPVSEYTQRKIYVSNVSPDLDPQKLLQFFAKYGEIEEGPLGMDKQTGRPKGFALFVYRSVESARKALEEPHKSLDGTILHCQKAIDGPKPNKPGSAFYHQNLNQRTQFPRNDNMGYMGGTGSATVAGGMGFSPAAVGPAVTAAGINPAIGQALTAILATQGSGLGLTNLLGTLGTVGAGSVVNPSGAGGAPMVSGGSYGMQGGYVNPSTVGGMNPTMMGGYGSQPAMQGGGYGNPQMGQGTGGRGQPGHMGGMPPYTGY
ncbi:Heterogeneous nuclear ribonucleoprotein 1 [Acorus calamus]|uniref:Heterogeneous nuclear ribonucleoprotein 1 n=1 Tax=Acorus calamus TaxID=4465 RepID=A0AAV9CZ92_ACOCL|nr:Heterogeneous nuclear ribonucleoprotein 1 [Acorus calamus]